MPKNLKKQIETKLEKLSQLLEQITESQVIDPNDPET
jgi:ribosome-associated translation inhibitor RaiA